MKSRKGLVSFTLLTILLLLAGDIRSVAQTDTPVQQVASENPIRASLETLAERLRAAMALAALAVASPSITDHHLHAQQVVNLLEGAEGRHFSKRVSSQQDVTPGLLADAQSISQALKAKKSNRSFEPTLFAARKVIRFLDLALEESLLGLRERKLDRAADRALRVYAYLSAALGRASDPAYLGGILTIIRLLSPPVSNQLETATP